MRLFDTSLKKYVDFAPDNSVKIYVCGITPYDSAHLGHIFTFMTYDLLQRRLEDKGHSVKLVRNITDVDEPIYARANEMGIPYTELAENETKEFHGVLKGLNFRKASTEPKASQYIDQMINAVSNLLDSGFAYKLENDVYYDVTKYSDYGKFSGFSPKLLRGLTEMRGGDPDRKGKRNPYDFLLWKGITDKSDPAQWPSPFGNGRPGWHIECTVMSRELLGNEFDIHGGGTDLIFPHHESEIAQSVGLGGTNPAKLWLHVSPLLHDGEKMSKSLGNLVFAKNLLDKYDAPVIRLALMHYHHRIGGEWQPELLEEAKRLWDRINLAAKCATSEQTEVLLAEVRAALDDDLNTLEVIDALHLYSVSFDNSNSTNPKTDKVIHQVYDLLGLR